MHFYVQAFGRGIYLGQLMGVCRWCLRARETLSNFFNEAVQLYDLIFSVQNYILIIVKCYTPGV